MKTLFALGVWCVLFVLCWPLAVLALIAWPFVWLLSLPFRLVGITFSALFAFLRALFMLPAPARQRPGGGMRAVMLVALALLAGPAPATPVSRRPHGWNDSSAAADEADAAAARAVKPRERCRVVKEWKAGGTVVQHRICDDPPKPAGKV